MNLTPARRPPRELLTVRRSRRQERGDVVACSSFGEQQGKMSEGRQAETLSFFQQHIGEAVEVVIDQSVENRMLGKIGLNHDLACHVATAGATRDLLEQSKEALGGAEVRAVEGVVRAQHADQGQLRK